MRVSRILTLTVIAFATLIITGCTPYVITHPLERIIDDSETCTVGSFLDELPSDMDPEDKPTMEEMMLFKNTLQDYLEEHELFYMMDFDESGSDYIIKARLLEFSRGSGTLRFLLAILPGAAAKIVTSIELINAKTGEVVFSGNFRGEVTDWSESGELMYNQVARNFVKALERQHKKLLKESSS